MSRPTNEEVIKHYEEGIDLQNPCLVCGNQLSQGYRYTDLPGQVKCETCGTSYQVEGWPLDNQLLKNFGVDHLNDDQNLKFAQMYCDCYPLLPILKTYWEKNKKKVPMGYSMVGAAIIPRDEVNAFFKWLGENAKDYEHDYGAKPFNFPAIKQAFQEKDDEEEEEDIPQENEQPKEDTPVTKQAPEVAPDKEATRFRLKKEMLGIPAKTLFYKNTNGKYVNKAVPSGKFISLEADNVIDNGDWFEKTDSKKWFPKKNEKYFFISTEGKIAEAMYDATPQMKKNLEAKSEFGNLFISRPVAEMTFLKVMEVLNEVQRNEQ